MGCCSSLAHARVRNRQISVKPASSSFFAIIPSPWLPPCAGANALSLWQTSFSSPNKDLPVLLGELLSWVSDISRSWMGSRGAPEAAAARPCSPAQVTLTSPVCPGPTALRGTDGRAWWLHFMGCSPCLIPSFLFALL